MRSQLLQEQSEFHMTLLEKGRSVPTEMVCKAERKIVEFRGLKSEIDTELAEILQRLQGLTQKIVGNVLSDENPEGLLTQA